MKKLIAVFIIALCMSWWVDISTPFMTIDTLPVTSIAQAEEVAEAKTIDIPKMQSSAFNPAFVVAAVVVTVAVIGVVAYKVYAANQVEQVKEEPLEQSKPEEDKSEQVIEQEPMSESEEPSVETQDTVLPDGEKTLEEPILIGDDEDKYEEGECPAIDSELLAEDLECINNLWWWNTAADALKCIEDSQVFTEEQKQTWRNIAITYLNEELWAEEIATYISGAVTFIHYMFDKTGFVADFLTKKVVDVFEDAISKSPIPKSDVMVNEQFFEDPDEIIQWNKFGDWLTDIDELKDIPKKYDFMPIFS